MSSEYFWTTKEKTDPRKRVQINLKTIKTKTKLLRKLEMIKKLNS